MVCTMARAVSAVTGARSSPRMYVIAPPSCDVATVASERALSPPERIDGLGRDKAGHAHRKHQVIIARLCSVGIMPACIDLPNEAFHLLPERLRVVQIRCELQPALLERNPDSIGKMRLWHRVRIV